MHRELSHPMPLPAHESGPLPEGDIFVMPSSVAQKRFWLLEQISPGNPALQIPIALRLGGPLRTDVLEHALDAIIARYEILRTHFALVGEELRQVISPEAKLNLRRIETEPSSPDARAEIIRREMLAEVRRPLDFFPAPLIRATLARLAEDDHVLLLTAHHIISDGWSNGILVREIAALYDSLQRGAPSPLPALQIQYADYAVWQESWLQTPAFARQLEFWKSALAGEFPVLDFPTDLPRRPGASQAPGAILETLLLPGDLSESLRQFCRREGITLFIVFYSAYVALLRRYTGQDCFVVGTTAANRNKPELEALVGLFANILMFRSEVRPGDSFRAFLQTQRELILGGFANHEAPFETVLEQCQKEQSGGGAKTAMQTHLLYQKAFMQPATAGDLEIQPLPSVSPGSTFELTFGIVERAEGIRLQMEYRVTLFQGATIRRLLRHFQALLESIIDHPELPIDDLPIFAPGEREELEDRLHPPAATSTPFDPALTLASLDRQIERHYQADDATPFLAAPELPPGAFLVTLNTQRRLLPIGIPGELYLGQDAARMDDISESDLAQSLLPTGFLGRNGENATELWGRREDQIIRQGYRLHRLAAPTALAPVRAATVSTSASMQESLQRQLLEIWEDILKVPNLTIDDNFFECGGTSFLALRMMIRAGQLAGRTLPLSLLLTGATVAHLARFILEAEKENEAIVPLTPVRENSTRPPLFFFHGDWAGGGFYCRKLADALGPDQPFFALPPSRRTGERLLSLREIAAQHVAAIRAQTPHGPYLLGGYCIGASIAMEAGRQLAAQGETVAQLLLVDPPFWSGPALRWLWPAVNRIGRARHLNLEQRIDLLDRYVVAPLRWFKSPTAKKWAAFQRRFSRKKSAPVPHVPVNAPPQFTDEEMLKGFDYSLYYLAHRLHRFKPLSLPATFYFPADTPPPGLDRLARASQMDPALYRIERVPGDHTTCVTTHASDLAAKIEQTLDSPGQTPRA